MWRVITRVEYRPAHFLQNEYPYPHSNVSHCISLPPHPVSRHKWSASCTCGFIFISYQWTQTLSSFFVWFLLLDPRNQAIFHLYSQICALFLNSVSQRATLPNDLIVLQETQVVFTLPWANGYSTKSPRGFYAGLWILSLLVSFPLWFSVLGL